MYLCSTSVILLMDWFFRGTYSYIDRQVGIIASVSTCV